MKTDPHLVTYINNQLRSLYGIDTVTGHVMWRVVFSEEQFEKRYGTYSDYTREGIYLRTVTEVREVPKYRQWIQEKWVLEQLTMVPNVNAEDLPGQKLSYEPMYVFEDHNNNPLPPNLTLAKMVIDTVYAALGKTNLAKYKDPEGTPEKAQAVKEASVKEMYEAMYGEETAVSDALHQGTGVIVPSNYEKEN